WLNIPVIAEGAETLEQVDFLRSVGCDYVQGYYFARPMPIVKYEELCHTQAFDPKHIIEKREEPYRYNDLFSVNPEIKLLFGNALQAAAIYEFVDDRIEIIRVNEAYYALLGHDDMLSKSPDLLHLADEGYREPLLHAFRVCAKTQGGSECDYLRHRPDQTPLWIHTQLRYISTVGNKHIITGELADITMRKEIDVELQKYRASLLSRNCDPHTVLIVDDATINRTVLKRILQDQFCFLEAQNGEEALAILQENRQRIDLILLDISMPKMDGNAFLQCKKQNPQFDAIPVIMIADDDSPAQQISSLSLGANDYIVKPFIPEVITRRIQNVLESNRRFREMIQQYNDMSEQVKTDRMTGLLNRASAESMIAQRLSGMTGACAMLMLDIDSFKHINDTRGHIFGDKVINAVALKLRSFFRKEDLVARMGGDEFSVLIENIPDPAWVEEKAHRLCRSIADMEIDGRPEEVTCSVGIAVSSEQAHSFETLYQNSDKALYSAKCHGRNVVSVYGEESAASSISNWINDAQSVLDALGDSVYACDWETYEMIYANDNLCRSVGVTREDCKGKKCYEILMHRDTPCEFCSLQRMSQEKMSTRLFQVPNTSDVFLMRGKNIRRNNMIIHLEVAVDVTQIE
ncbi:MAG: diguanylate cyclase, partial [Oscillospiraceae bacterium]